MEMFFRMEKMDFNLIIILKLNKIVISLDI
jgi:hypothetical protein